MFWFHYHQNIRYILLCHLTGTLLIQNAVVKYDFYRRKNGKFQGKMIRFFKSSFSENIYRGFKNVYFCEPNFDYMIHAYILGQSSTRTMGIDSNFQET